MGSPIVGEEGREPVILEVGRAPRRLGRGWDEGLLVRAGRGRRLLGAGGGILALLAISSPGVFWLIYKLAQAPDRYRSVVADEEFWLPLMFLAVPLGFAGWEVMKKRRSALGIRRNLLIHGEMVLGHITESEPIIGGKRNGWIIEYQYRDEDRRLSGSDRIEVKRRYGLSLDLRADDAVWVAVDSRDHRSTPVLNEHTVGGGSSRRPPATNLDRPPHPEPISIDPGPPPRRVPRSSAFLRELTKSFTRSTNLLRLAPPILLGLWYYLRYSGAIVPYDFYIFPILFLFGLTISLTLTYLESVANIWGKHRDRKELLQFGSAKLATVDKVHRAIDTREASDYIVEYSYDDRSREERFSRAPDLVVGDAVWVVATRSESAIWH